MDERQQKTAAAIAEAGADWAVLTSPDAVAYAAGHVVPIEAGPSPFAGGPTTALVGRDGRCAVVCANVEGAAAAASRADVVESYEGFGFETGPDLEANYLDAFRKAKAALGLGGRAAVERVSCPFSIADDLGESVSITGPLARMRAVKTDLEIAALRRAAEVATAGQHAFREAAAPGRTELDAFAEIRRAMESAAGERLPVTGDFISGTERTAGFTGWPTDRVMQHGDPVMSDLAPRVGGYWGDSCSSAVLGEPTDGWRAMFNAAREALMEARELIRPGLRIDELDSRLRASMSAQGYGYPHHTGHAIGTSVHEWPRIVPYETAHLVAGMVLMIEPGAYDPELGGVRTEWMFLVTETGCEPLTTFEFDPVIR